MVASLYNQRLVIDYILTQYSDSSKILYTYAPQRTFIGSSDSSGTKGAIEVNYSNNSHGIK